jgi:hypothetical protein
MKSTVPSPSQIEEGGRQWPPPFPLRSSFKPREESASLLKDGPSPCCGCRLPPCPPWTAGTRRCGRFRRAAIYCVTRKSSLPRAGCPCRLPSPSIRCWIWRPPAILLSQEVNPGADQGRSHHQPPWLGRRSSRRRLLLPYGGALQEHAEHHRCSLGGQVLLCLSQVGVCNHESPRQP